MLDINFDTLLRTEVFISGISSGLSDFRRFFTDYLAPFTYSEIDDIFETEGRGLWADLDPLYAIQKSRAFPGKGILEREGTYREAATGPSHPGSLVEVSQTELVVGVRPSAFEANYPAIHEEGNEEGNLSARPVYELIAAGAQFSEQVAQLGEKWQSEEIAAAERGLR